VILAETCEELLRELDRDKLRLAWERTVRTLETLSYGRSVASDHLLALKNLRSRALATQDSKHRTLSARQYYPGLFTDPPPLTEGVDHETRNSSANLSEQQREAGSQQSADRVNPPNFLWSASEDRGATQHQSIETTTNRNYTGDDLDTRPSWFDDDTRADADMALLRPFTDWDLTLETFVLPTQDSMLQHYCDPNTVPHHY